MGYYITQSKEAFLKERHNLVPIYEVIHVCEGIIAIICHTTSAIIAKSMEQKYKAYSIGLFQISHPNPGKTDFDWLDSRF